METLLQPERMGLLQRFVSRLPEKAKRKRLQHRLQLSAWRRKATVLIDVAVQPREMDASAAMTAPRQVTATTVDTSAPPLLEVPTVAAAEAATALVYAPDQPRHMDASAAKTAPRQVATTTADTLTPPPEANLTDAAGQAATAVIAVSHPSSVSPQQTARGAGVWTSPQVQASSVAAVHASTALVDAATQLYSSAATSAQRQVAAATVITSVEICLVDTEHAVTALVKVVSQPQELNSSAATLAAFQAKHDVDERYTIPSPLLKQNSRRCAAL